MAKKEKSKKQKQRKKENQSSQTDQDNPSSQKNQEELLKVDLTSQENWEAFYRRKEIADQMSEWYAEWPELQELLTENLLVELSELEKPIMERMCDKGPEELRILVPACGNSKLSEHLHDHSFRNVTNVDFSKVAITDMMTRNLRERPAMKWRVMDMTDLKFGNESFDAVVDKAGLDVLMSSKIRPSFGNLYLSQVKRVLTAKGKLICLTLAEPHVLDLLFRKFRFGWKMSLRLLDRMPYNKNSEQQIFVVVVEKHCPASVYEIASFLDEYSVESHGEQARDFHKALEKERKIREEIINSSEVVYSLEDLRLGAKGDISVAVPGRRIKLILGEPGVSCFSYKGILLDSKNDSEDINRPYAVCVVPQEKSRLPPYLSEEGQWSMCREAKFTRLLMVLMDTCNSIVPTEKFQDDLYPLVMELAPANFDSSTMDIHSLFLGDGIVKRDVVYQDISDLTGSIVVEDVIYDVQEGNKDYKYRRLTFQRAEILVQSEALISTKRSSRRRKPKQQGSQFRELDIDRSCITSLYHQGVLASMELLFSHFRNVIMPPGTPMKVLVIGLGGGIYPMYLRKNISYFNIEVVELDPMVLDIAREYFSFQEDEQLKVHIGDGIEFMKDIADSEPEEKSNKKFDIIMVDTDSTEWSGGLSRPGGRFVEESFLVAARESMSEHALLCMNLASRSSCLKQGVYSTLKKVFGNVFRVKVDGDASEVVIGAKTERRVLKEELSQTQERVLASFAWNPRAAAAMREMELLS